MNKQVFGSLGSFLERLSSAATHWAGSSFGFGAAVAGLALWAATGPFAHFSETWQLVVNTATTIVTFLMVFLIQRSQNKESQAIQLKLDELVRALAGANNGMIDIEDLTEPELTAVRQKFRALVARDEGPLPAQSVTALRAESTKATPV